MHLKFQQKFFDSVEADIVSKDFNNHQTEFSMFEGEASLGKQLALESIYYVDYDKVKSNYSMLISKLIQLMLSAGMVLNF